MRGHYHAPGVHSKSALMRIVVINCELLLEVSAL